MATQKKLELDTNAVGSLFVVADLDRALAFYQKAFGFSLRHVDRDDGGRAVFASVNWLDSTVRMACENAFGLPRQAPISSKTECPVVQYVYVPDVDQLHRMALAGGAVERAAPMDAPHGDRICILSDPDGYVWYFATKLPLATAY